MNQNYAVINVDWHLVDIDTREKLLEIIHKSNKTHEDYYCCENDENETNQTCYFKGILKDCENFRNHQDEDVQECMRIIQCNKK